MAEPRPAWCAVACALSALALCAAGSRAETARTVVSGSTTQVIINTSVAGDEVTPEALRSILSLRMRHWGDGSRITIFVFPDDQEVHRRFCKEHLRAYPYVLRTLWDRAVFSGTAPEPIMVRETEEMRRRVAATPGAIGYLDAVRAAAARPTLGQTSSGRPPLTPAPWSRIAAGVTN